MNLLSATFWFNTRPGLLTPMCEKILIGLVLFFLIISFTTWIIQFKKKNLYTTFWRKLSFYCLVNLFIGLILLFFNYELIPFLSSRFWFLLWGLIIIIWFIFISKILLTIPKKQKSIEEKKQYQKYIP